jgi:hypothetical protein
LWLPEEGADAIPSKAKWRGLIYLLLFHRKKKSTSKDDVQKRLYLIQYLNNELEPVGLEEGPPV